MSCSRSLIHAHHPGVQAPGNKVFLVPAHRLAEVCGQAYDASLHVQATVNIADVSSGTWDLGKAAAAARDKSWIGLLQSSVTTLAEACNHALQLVAEQDLLSSWRQATSPACAPYSCACLLCTACHAAHAISNACYGMRWTGLV